jgi:uncharacterized protein (TIGR02391 family)
MDAEKNIEFQEIIGEAKSGSYQPVRFTRIKYKNNRETFIDVRKFQRQEIFADDKNEEDKVIYHPTKHGFQFPEREFKKVVNNWTIMPSAYVHPHVIEKSFDLINKRQFESAVLQAYKIIEIKIREKAELSVDDFGVNLIRKAFNPDNGSLSDMNLPIAERQALSNYIAGAYALFKNPVSHREVKMEFFEAFEKIVVASQILKIVEESTKN